MASGYDLPRELRTLGKLFDQQRGKCGRNPVTIFDDFLTYIIYGLNPFPEPDPSWTYTKEENKIFHDMMLEYFSVMDVMLNKREWYDAFGDFFMAVISPVARQYRGQFFTPSTICDFMAKIIMGDKDEKLDEPRITCGGFGKRVVVNDSAAGSSRMLLAAHVIACNNEQSNRYMVAEDVDRICCKMSAINLCTHGCFGEVVCHDTLLHPEEVTFGYKINEMLYPIPACPSIRPCKEPQAFICTQMARSWREQRTAEVTAEAIAKAEKEEPKKTAKEKIPQQLSLNFL